MCFKILEPATANLVFIYGPSGSGKTRLLQTLESVLPGESVLRVGLESVIREMAAFARTLAGREAFREKFLGFDNLLLENLWVLEKKPETAARNLLSPA